jgi:hypothetical protein
MTAPTANDPHGQDSVDNLLNAVHETDADDTTTPTEDLSERDAADFDSLAMALTDEAFDPVVLAAVDQVVDDSESVGVPARQRLIAGAERGVRWHRRAAGALPPLLQEGRRISQTTAAAIAEAAGLPEKAVHQVERGDVTVDELAPGQLAAWIRKVSLNSRLALDALKRTLQLPDASTVYASSGNRGETSDIAHKAFYDAVAKELGEGDDHATD